MIVTTRFPDLQPHPGNAAHAEWLRRFAERWGRENVVFMASARQVHSPPLRAALSLKCIESGTATLFVNGRRVVVPAGRSLLVNRGDTYEVQIHEPAPMRCFSVHFRPGLAAQVAAARRHGWDAALDDEGAAAAHPGHDADPHFVAGLHTPAPPVLQGLRQVRALAAAGVNDEAAFEAPFIALLDALLDQDSTRRSRARATQALRPATREELARRAALAHDFIVEHHAEPIDLAQIAAAAHLSKYHLLRVFARCYGATPHALLQAHRAQVAMRLLREAPDRPLEAVAQDAGFGSRWTMQRALRRHSGSSATALRRQV
jgi:AraC-like DNA-binding protein